MSGSVQPTSGRERRGGRAGGADVHHDEFHGTGSSQDLDGWSHNNTTTTLKKSRSCVATLMSGEFHYTVHGVGVHLPADVLASDAASGGTLHSVTYHDC